MTLSLLMPAAAISGLLALCWPWPGAATQGPGLFPQPDAAPSRRAAPAAVFGKDDRVALPVRYNALRSSIGLLFSVPARTVCSAFCVADNVVATAAHCLFRTSGEHPPPLAGFWFARQFADRHRLARIAGTGTGAAAQHIMAGSMRLSLRPPIDATSDWALVRLDRPACQDHVLPLRPLSPDAIAREATAQRLYQVGYHRDFIDWRLAYSRPCAEIRQSGTEWGAVAKDFSRPDLLVLHTCDTGGASSGSPLLVDGANGPEVVGINVGTYMQARVVTQKGQVLHRYKASNVANTAVAAQAFADRLAVFRDAHILSSGSSLQSLQARLKMLKYYVGRVDGSYGPALRDAIRAFEAAQNSVVTGLATVSLLRRLEEIPASVPRPPPDPYTAYLRPPETKQPRRKR
ncbi:MAG: peptidoglycan-binding protein [Hyphomicrobiaceae bacterium]